MNNILVTGATGFVGKAVCRQLQRADRRVHALIRKESAAPREEGIVWHEYEGLDDEAGIARAMRGMDGVIHLAARVHQMNDPAADPLAEFMRVNVEGTRRLAEAAVRSGVRRFVYVSSIKAETGDARLDPYGYSKKKSEELLLELGRSSALEVVVFRPCLVYGPGVKANFLSLLKAVRAGIPLPLAGLQNKRSYLFVGNLADALIRALDSAGAISRVLPLSDGRDVSTTELIRLMAAAAGVRATLFRVPGLLTLAGALTGRRAAVQRLTGSLTVDSAPARTALPWTPPVSLEEGIRQTVAWYLHMEKERARHV